MIRLAIWQTMRIKWPNWKITEKQAKAFQSWMFGDGAWWIGRGY